MSGGESVDRLRQAAAQMRALAAENADNYHTGDSNAH